MYHARLTRFFPVVIVITIVMVACAALAWAEEPLRAGILGLDTSHAVAFTQLLNDPKATGPLADVKVVAAFAGGSQDIPFSHDRVKGFTEKVRRQGVEICPTIDELLSKIDVVFLESVDGRAHLEQAKAVFKAGKPVFIDKPLAATLADAVEIFQLAKERNVPCFSASSLRFSAGAQRMRLDPPVGRVIGCDAYSPCHLEPHHPDLFWYGIHGVEILFTIMGSEIESVSRVQTNGTDLAVGVWRDGRVGTFRGIRQGRQDYGAFVFGAKGIASAGKYDGYKPLVVEIVKFFKSGKPPVSAEETLAIYAFMEAADQSKREGGRPVSIESVLTKAQAEVAARK